MKIYLVSDNVDTLVGMRLAGIEGCVVHEQGELKKAIDHALEDKEIGILLLTEKFGREYPELINKVKLDHKLPLIIEVPDRHGTGRKLPLQPQARFHYFLRKRSNRIKVIIHSMM